MEPIYTVSATASGGRFEGRVVAQRGTFDLEVNPPGQGEGTNPEELLAAGYAACFANAAIVIARKTRQDPDGLEVDARVSLGKHPEEGYQLGLTLELRAPGLAQDAAEELVQAAHRRCPFSRAVDGNVEVRLVAVGGGGGG